MDYQRVHNQIVDRALNEDRSKGNGIYYEQHHIIPKCLGGSNSRDNLVLLTGREHFLIHYLLMKIYPNEYKLKCAFAIMSRYFPNSHIYQVNKEILADTRRSMNRDFWDNSTPEEMEDWKRKRAAARKPMTEIRRDELSKRMKAQSVLFWAGLTCDEKAIINDKKSKSSRNYFANRPEGKKQSWLKNLKKSKKKYFARLTDDDKHLFKIRNSKSIYNTPAGTFYSLNEACEANDMSRDMLFHRIQNVDYPNFQRLVWDAVDKKKYIENFKGQK